MSIETRRVTVYPQLGWGIENEDIEFVVTADADILTDPTYGADADGNRVRGLIEISEIRFTSANLFIGDRRGIPLGVGTSMDLEAALEHILTAEEMALLLDLISEVVWRD
jgi:hypothetical protein